MNRDSSADQFRVLALVGVYAADLDHPGVRPVVAGTLSEDVWNHQTQEETDRDWNKLRTLIDPSGMDYLWREAWLTLDAATMRPHFSVPAAPAEAPATPDEHISLLLLAGVHVGDFDHPDHHDSFIPVIAGSVDETVWGMETEQDTAARWEDRKRDYGAANDCLWREIWVSVPENTLRDLFAQPVIATVVHPPSDSQTPADA